MSYVLAGIIGAFLATAIFFVPRLGRPNRAPQIWYVVLSISISIYLSCQALGYTDPAVRGLVWSLGRLMEGSGAVAVTALLGFAASLAAAPRSNTRRALVLAPLGVCLYALMTGTGIWLARIDRFRTIVTHSGEHLHVPAGPTSYLLPLWLLVAYAALVRAAAYGVTLWRAGRRAQGTALFASSVLLGLAEAYDVAVARGLVIGPNLMEYALLGIACIALVQTVTDERRKEAKLAAERASMLEQMRAMQRMEALGRLAGSVAHDFNNLLTVMLGGTELAKRRIHEPDSALRILDSVEMAARSASALTHQLLAFARREVVEPVVIPLAEHVLSLKPMLGRLMSENIRLTVEAAAPHLHVRIDPTQLEQIVFNLVTNAAQAMPMGGEIQVRVDRAARPPDRLRRGSTGVGKGFAEIRVRDTGTGIAPEHLTRIFEPFFTTKPRGQGTGLGLATVYGASQQAGGGVSVDSKLGAGTTFTVFLPITDAAPSAHPATEPQFSSCEKETILLVENHDAAREIICSQLQTLGYQVIALSSGGAALDFVGHIDAVVSDVIMPDLSGPELVLRLRTQRPNIPALFITGHAEDELSSRGLMLESFVVLSKPFTLDTLASALERVMSRGRVDATAAPPETQSMSGAF
jgi:signal transduction histidine kinase/CheY-like chemotaxis protein